MTFSPGTPPTVIAHRGGIWPGTTENTLEAFLTAWSHGITHLETDVHVSADGVLFAAHDDDLRRIADRPEQLADLKAAELDRIELTAGGTLPRLTSLLEALPDAHINIDVKADRSVGAVIRLLRGRRDGDRIRLASFSTARLGRLRQALPGIATSVGTLEAARLRIFGSAGFTPAAGVDAVQVPGSWHGVPVLTEHFVRAAHRLGLRVDAWTINDPADMLRLAALGVDGLVTDVPVRCQQVLAGGPPFASDDSGPSPSVGSPPSASVEACPPARFRRE